MREQSESGSENSDCDECWCCGGLHDSLGLLCPDCDDWGCQYFSEECQSDHKPVFSDGETERQRLIECQYCDAVHESVEGHEEHVERMHYAETLRNSESVHADKERDSDE